MADKLKKFLARLSGKELDSVLALLIDVRNNELSHLDVKSLKGHKHIYRIRKGSIRVIFYSKDSQIRILSITRRDGQTYKDF